MFYYTYNIIDNINISLCLYISYQLLLSFSLENTKNIKIYLLEYKKGNIKASHLL